jgi:hypothetical protein
MGPEYDGGRWGSSSLTFSVGIYFGNDCPARRLILHCRMQRSPALLPMNIERLPRPPRRRGRFFCSTYSLNKRKRKPTSGRVASTADFAKHQGRKSAQPELEKAFQPMKDFPNGSFPPDTIKIMTSAMESAISTLPHPVSSARTQSVAESILRSAKEGERDPAVLARLALLELIISPRA